MSRVRVSGWVIASAGAVTFAASPAAAFENQWHIGAGGGIETASDGYEAGPLALAYVAYGISDVFDARLELSGSWHETDAGNSSLGGSALAGIAYKLDVIRWVPWIAVYAGYRGQSEVLALSDYRHHDADLAYGGGIDYAWDRNFGLGASARYEYLLTRGGDAHFFSAVLRAEYRWGF